MNTEIWRHIFDAIENPLFHPDTQIRVSRANIAYCREAGTTGAETPGVDCHLQLVHAKNQEVES